MLNRTTGGYILMALGSAALLWSILRLGSKQHAPPDWSGQWEVVQSANPGTATIMQSGVYLVLKRENEPARSYKMRINPDATLLQIGDRNYTAVLERGEQGTLLRIADPTRAEPTIRLWRETKDASK